jgi:hypothetical protein
LPGFRVEAGKTDFRESWGRKSRLFPAAVVAHGGEKIEADTGLGSVGPAGPAGPQRRSRTRVERGDRGGHWAGQRGAGHQSTGGRRRSDELHACVGAGDRWAHSYGATATCYGHGTRAPCSHRRRRRRRFSIPIVCGVALAPPRLIVVKPAAHCPPCLLNCYSLNIFFISREIETWEGRIVYKSCSFVL